MRRPIALIVGLALVTSPRPTRAASSAEFTLAEVAGSYYFGDGLGANCTLTVDAAGSFRFRWTGCLGEYGRNRGPATIVNGHLILGPEEPNESGGFGGTPVDFIPVRWGRRLYLVPASDGKRFCNDANFGTEPRRWPQGSYYLREKDWDRAVAGAPAVPAEWRSWLLPMPVRGTITGTLKGGRAEVDLGGRDGVFAGMDLWVETGGLGVAEVVSVADGSCIVRRKYDVKDGFPFRAGQRVSSRLEPSAK